MNYEGLRDRVFEFTVASGIVAVESRLGMFSVAQNAVCISRIMKRVMGIVILFVLLFRQLGHVFRRPMAARAIRFCGSSWRGFAVTSHTIDALMEILHRFVRSLNLENTKRECGGNKEAGNFLRHHSGSS